MRSATTHGAVVAVLVVAMAAAGAVAGPQPDGGLAAGPSATGAAAAPTNVTGFVLEQGDQCVPLDPLESGTDVESFYDYRHGNSSPAGAFSSYMDVDESWDLQADNTSRLFLHEAPDGALSLVVVHSEYGAPGDGNGYAVTFEFDGLRSSEEWVVEDDGYPDRDDDFERGAQKIDWIWTAGRTDGVAVGEVTAETDFTITPYFNEAAEKYDDYQRNGTIDAWEVLAGDIEDPDVEALEMDQPVHVQAGACGDDGAPNASLTATEEASVGQEVTFDASASTDDNGVVEYQWDFDGDNAVDRTTGTPTTGYSYAHATNYTATVTVVDTVGQTDEATTTVEVTDDTPPTASVDAPDQVAVGETFTADGSGTTDDGTVVSYDWQFGDGTNGSGQSVTHSYDAPGNYTVTLTATDSGGNADTATVTVNATDADLTPPDAALSVDPGTAEVGATTVTFDASNSTDDGSLATYRWDFDGDGAVEATTETATTTHVYAAPDTYAAAVEVVDAAGNADQANATVTAEDTTPPAANVSVPATVAPNETFEADGAASTDNHAVADYAWEFGDGTTAAGETATHEYDAPGNYTVTLTVTDASGHDDAATATVQVEESDGGDDPGGGGSDPGDGDPGNPGRNPGGGGGGGGSGGGGGGGGSAPASSTVTVESASAGAFDVQVDGVADDAALVPLPPAGDGTAVEFSDLPVEIAQDDEFRLAVETGPAPAGAAASNATLAPTHDGFVGLATLDAEARGASNGTVDGATVVFSVPGERLADANATPDAVSVYRLDGDTWTAVDASVSGPTAADEPAARDGSYRFRAETDRLGRFAVGLDRPALAVTDLAVSAAEPRVGETVTVTATVENRGRAAGQFEGVLTVDGEAVRNVSASVPAGDDRTVTVSREVRAAGEHAVALGGETVRYDAAPRRTTVAVTPTTDESTAARSTTTGDGTAGGPTASGGQPGFGLAVALVALLTATLLRVRR